MGFGHRHRVRYVECDMQGVMHNSHYLAVVDDAVDVWTSPLAAAIEAADWDFMVKRAELTWHAPARLGDELVLAVDLRRWGSTSFDVGVEAVVDDTPCFSAQLTYVGVDRAHHRPAPIPAFVREQLR